MTPNSLTAHEPRPTADERDARAEELKRHAATRGLWLGLGSTALCFVLELLGISGFQAMAFVFVPGTLLTLGVCVLISLDIPRFRAKTTRAIHALAYAIALFLLSYPLSFVAHSFSVNRARARAEPLIDALHAYEERFSEPAPALDALVPEFLSAVPKTGRISAPEYGYHRFEPSGSRPAFWYVCFDATRFVFGPTFVYTSNEPGSPIRGRWSEDSW
ncbi:MAG: hypothetical protein NTV21_14685 [Planctomycetota bacterium]|nr:hypothetical protein [Planctomycetota bacterium]